AIAHSTPANSRSRQWHPSLSPVQWHLGHIGIVEDFWIRQHCWQQSDRHPSYSLLFDPTRTPKWSRQTLPPLTDLLNFLQEVRQPFLRWLHELDMFPENESLLSCGWIVAMVLQHECQHQETMQMVRYLMPVDEADEFEVKSFLDDEIALAPASSSEFVRVPAGELWQGSDDPVWSLDNERSPHRVRVKEFAIARTPVTNAGYLDWMESGGYERREAWSEAGWIWKTQQRISHPIHWRDRGGRWQQRSLSGWVDLIPDRPVMGVSWYEADAYARSLGYRLPTESEWERAATLDRDWDASACLRDRGDRFDELTWGETKGVLERSGCVWEWTATPFHPYPEFRPFPYREYSEPWFDDHYSLRGGSWATHPLLRRPTFRNWYEPQVREIFAGIRCAKEIHG
ncbi:MAG: SUMF1/EgtB/PvdO family nonheme iron enzyme, partial [Cyanobacteria bacterium J06639_1]